MKWLIAIMLAVPTFGASVFTLGTNEFADGSALSTGGFQTGVDSAPFNIFTGSDISGPNASFTFTFNYSAPATITTASILISLYDLDSVAAGSQIASFTLNSTEDLTTSLDALSEAKQAASGTISYLTLTLPSSAFAALQTGSASFSLAFAAPGQGVLGSTTFNGGGIDFAQLSFTTVNDIPEPSSLALAAGGLALLLAKRLRR